MICRGWWRGSDRLCTHNKWPRVSGYTRCDTRDHRADWTLQCQARTQGHSPGSVKRRCRGYKWEPAFVSVNSRHFTQFLSFMSDQELFTRTLLCPSPYLVLRQVFLRLSRHVHKFYNDKLVSWTSSRFIDFTTNNFLSFTAKPG